MNLFNELGNIFNPDPNAFYFAEDKVKAYDIFVRFKKMKPDQVGFLNALNDVDRQITHLFVEYNFTPAWAEEYNRICDRYFSPMEVKVISNEFKINLN